GVGRVSWQVTPKNRVVTFIDREAKNRTNNGVSTLIPPDVSGRQYTLYNYVGDAKLTSTLTSRLLFEGGMGMTDQRWATTYKVDQPESLLASQELTTSIWSGAYPTGDQQKHTMLRVYNAS